METVKKAVELLICSSNDDLFKIWEESENDSSEYTGEMRGLLMDEFSRRDPEGFDEWLHNWGELPRTYIKKQRPGIVQEWTPCHY